MLPPEITGELARSHRAALLADAAASRSARRARGPSALRTRTGRALVRLGERLQ